MSEHAKPVSVHVNDTQVIVTLADGHIISNLISWHPWLERATPEQRKNVKLYAFSVDWPDLDEGLDIEGMIREIRSSPYPVNK